MTPPRPPQRQVVPPPIAYRPPLPVRPRSRVKRNLLVWTICAIVIIAAVWVFQYLMVPPETQRILNDFPGKPR